MLNSCIDDKGIAKKLNPLSKLFISMLFISFGVASKTIECKLMLLLFLFSIVVLFNKVLSMIKSLPGLILMITPMLVIMMILGTDIKNLLNPILNIGFIWGTFIIFSMTTTPAELIRGISRYKLQTNIKLAILLVFRFTTVLTDEMKSIKNAYMLNENLKGVNGLYRGILVPFVYRMYNITDNLTIALYLKGFGQAKTSKYKEIVFTSFDYIFLLSVVFIIGGIVWIY